MKIILCIAGVTRCQPLEFWSTHLTWRQDLLKKGEAGGSCLVSESSEENSGVTHLCIDHQNGKGNRNKPVFSLQIETLGFWDRSTCSILHPCSLEQLEEVILLHRYLIRAEECCLPYKVAPSAAGIPCSCPKGYWNPTTEFLTSSYQQAETGPGYVTPSPLLNLGIVSSQISPHEENRQWIVVRAIAATPSPPPAPRVAPLQVWAPHFFRDRLAGISGFNTTLYSFQHTKHKWQWLV